MSIRINDWFVAGNSQKTNSDWNATGGYAQILNKPTNLVHTTGDETIQGIKTFSSIPLSVTPSVSSNDTSIATTEFVNTKISNHDENITAHSDIRQLITNTNNNISTSIDSHNNSNAAHSDIRQLITNTNNNISTSIDSHNNSSLSHNDIRLAINSNSNLISSISDDLLLETSQRNSDVNSLQQQIDALTSKGDVTDIVGTYNDLLNYDTSTLLNKSIIKVLTDSTHDNTSSYYKWNSSTSSFTYIGSETPTYSKSEIDDMDTLVVHKAGTENITGTKTFKNTNIKGGYVTSTSETNNRYFEIQSYDSSNNMRGLYQIWRGSNNQTSNIIKVYNASGNSCEIRAIVADDGSTYTYAPTPSSASNDNNIATTAWVNTTGNNVVHKTDAETIDGNKTFTGVSTLNRSGDVTLLNVKNGSMDVTVNPSTNYFSHCRFTDKNDLVLSEWYLRDTSTERELKLFVKDKTNTSKGNLIIGCDANDVGYVKCDAPSASNSTSLTNIATVGWVNDDTKSTNVVHRSGTETITGNKTFSGTVSLGSSATATTQTSTDNSTKVATTAFVKSAITASSGLTPPNYSAYTSISSGYVATANGWIRCEYIESEKANAWVKIDNVVVFGQTTSGSDYGAFHRFGMVPVAKNQTVTKGSGANIWFVPCI